jgi:DNA-directed RNA polymerase subunit RPC12/RpoP
LARFIERSTRDWWTTTWKLALLIAMLAFAVLVIYPWRGFLATFLVIIVTIWTYVSFGARKSGYRCAKCGRVFQVPTAVNFFTMSAMGKNPDGTYYSYKELTCPHCHKRSKARVVKRAELDRRATGKLLK